jgi:formylglycine-generating enzyme required for sulfatase activity
MRGFYRTAADPGLRAAAEWLLRRWHEEQWLAQTDAALAKDKERREADIREVLAKEKEKAPPQWYVNSQGQTMVVLAGPVRVTMGSPPKEADRSKDEDQHREWIDRAFALAAKPVTLREFRRFTKECQFAALLGDMSVACVQNNEATPWILSLCAVRLSNFGGEKDYPFVAHYTPTADCPVPGPSWYQAAAYCNWLSAKEGIPKNQWCYEPNENGKYADGMKLAENYWERTGYRLALEVEWEYACRAGAVTSRYYGETEELLGHYGCYAPNSVDHAWPVGIKKPNDLGFFDMHGNVWNWCLDKYQEGPRDDGKKLPRDGEEDRTVKNEVGRVLRGGSFDVQAWVIRCAYRRVYNPYNKYPPVSFRVARTFR